METTWLLQDDLPKETNWDVQLLWIILCSDLRNLQASHPQTWLFYPSIWPFQIFFCLRNSKPFADFVEFSLSRHKTCENEVESMESAGRS